MSRPSYLEGQFLCQHPESHPLRLCQLGHEKSKTSLSIVSVSSLPYRSLIVHSVSFMKYFSTCRRVVCLSHKLEEVQLFHSPICTSYYYRQAHSRHLLLCEQEWLYGFVYALLTVIMPPQELILGISLFILPNSAVMNMKDDFKKKTDTRT